MLQFARQNQWPIVHVQHIQEGDLFNAQSDLSDFVDGFSPLPGETHAKKGDYSSFSSPAFTEFVQAHADHEFVVIGYGSTMCCMSTIIDGYCRGHRFALMANASAALASEKFSETSMHEHAVEILRRFARIESTQDEVAPASVTS